MSWSLSLVVVVVLYNHSTSSEWLGWPCLEIWSSTQCDKSLLIVMILSDLVEWKYNLCALFYMLSGGYVPVVDLCLNLDNISHNENLVLLNRL